MTDIELDRLENKIREICYELDTVCKLENPDITDFNMLGAPNVYIQIRSYYIKRVPAYLPFYYCNYPLRLYDK